jgi:polar amino acid transport system permease protein
VDWLTGTLPPLLKGAAFTAGLTVAAGILGLAIAFVVGLSRDSRFAPVRWVLGLYVQVFRGTSALVQLFIVFYVLPTFGLYLPAFVAGVAVLALNTGAYGSEVVRAAVVAVDRGQRDAVVAINMPSRLAMRRIILPQAVPQMIPPFSNLLIELLKGTALVSLIAITDLAFAGKQVIATGAQAPVVYATMLALYFLMAAPITRGGAILEARLTRRMHLGRAQ